MASVKALLEDEVAYQLLCEGGPDCKIVDFLNALAQDQVHHELRPVISFEKNYVGSPKDLCNGLIVNPEIGIATLAPLHIPANVAIRAERRVRALSCPPTNDDSHSSVTRQVSCPEAAGNPATPLRAYGPLEGNTLSITAQFAVHGTSRQQKLILAALALVDFLSYMCLSILAPFFPKEAADRNISDTLQGWIFGVFALVQFLTSPFFGKMLPKTGSRFMFISGVFLGGGCTILFGLLDYVSPKQETAYIILCFLLRVVAGIGCTASNTASFAIMADTFPDNVGSVFGILETFTGVGLMAGPAIGGLLYEAGGFSLPFTILGGIMCAGVPLCMLILPKDNNTEMMVSHEGAGARGSYKDLLRMPVVLVVCVSITSAALVWSLLDPTLEPHLREFKLSTAIVGLIFLLCSAFYAISAPLWGWITDKVNDGCILLTIGFLASSVAFLILGPSQLLGFSKNYNELWLNLVSLIILGLSVSLASVPTFEKILDVAEQEGIEDGLLLYGTVGGIWGSANALGEFIGPSIGGTLVSMLGFGWTMTICSGICLLMGAINFICWCYGRCKNRLPEKNEPNNNGFTERTPLLSKASVPIASCSSRVEDDSSSDDSDHEFRTINRTFPVLSYEGPNYGTINPNLAMTV